METPEMDHINSPISLSNVRATIVSREACFKCTDIKEALLRENIKAIVLYFKEGGATYLAENKHMPLYLPSTFLYKDEKLVFVADGLADFMEKWEDFLGG